MKKLLTLFRICSLFKSITGLMFTLCLLASSCQADWYLDHYRYDGYRAGRIINIDSTAYPPINSDDPSWGGDSSGGNGGHPDPNFVGEKTASDGSLGIGVSGSASVRRASSRSFLTKLSVNVTPIYKWAGVGTPSTEFWIRERGHISVYRAHSIGGSSNPHHPYSEQDPYKGQNIFIQMASDGFDDLDKNPALMDGTKQDGYRAYGTHKNFYDGTTSDNLWSQWHVRSGDWGYLPGGWHLDKRTAPAGDTEVAGETRHLFATVKVPSLSNSDQYEGISTFLNAIYDAEVCQFSLGVSSDIIWDNTKHPRDRSLVAYATRNHTNRYQTELPSVFFWDGNANYSADISNNLLSTLRTPTDGTPNQVTPQYTWSTRTSGQYGGVSSPIVPPQELGSYYPPTSDDIARGTIEPSTQQKYFHHNVGTKDGTRWNWSQSQETRTRVIVSGSQGTGNLTAKAQIRWYGKPVTNYLTETTLEVYDAETGELTLLKDELVGFDDGAPEDIDAQIDEIRKAYADTVTTGAEAVELALTAEMMVGTWFVPDEFDVIVPVVGGVAGKGYKVFKGAKKLAAMMQVIHRVGDKSYEILKKTNKWRDKACGIRMRTRTFRESRGGHIPVGDKRTDEILGEVNHEISGDAANQPVRKWVGKACFIAGTPILMADDTLKAIEQVEAGDTVMSRNESTGEVSAKKVAQTFVRDTAATLALTLAGGEVIETTSEHPFYVEGYGFKRAGEIGIGTSIVTRAGPSLQVLARHQKPQASTVYNLEVEDFHTYFVGNSTLWVHNLDCDDLRNPATTEANRLRGDLSYTASNQWC